MAKIKRDIFKMVEDLGFDEAAKVFADLLGVDYQDGRMYLSISLGIIDGDVETVATNAS